MRYSSVVVKPVLMFSTISKSGPTTA